MRCANCARMLPDDVRFCFSCGSPIVVSDGTNVGTASASGSPIDGIHTDVPPAQVQANNADQEVPAEAGFVFQEFNGTASTFQPSNQVRPLPGAAGLAPFANVPNHPRPAAYLAGRGVYPQPLLTAQASRPKRRGRSIGWIIFYSLLAIALVFAILIAVLFEVTSNFVRTTNANHAAAMQLYQQVTSKPPVVQDAINDASYNDWETFQNSNFGCTLSPTGLNVHISPATYFTYCLNTTSIPTNFAFQIQMQILSGNAGGLVFRIISSANSPVHRYYIFRVDSNGNYIVYINKNASVTTLSRLTLGTTSAMKTQTNTLTVIAKGKVFDLYVNQQFVVQFQDATLAAGNVGVFADDQSVPANILYTNIKLWNLSA